MRVLVVGGLGSIGSRYVAILKWLGHDPVIYDTAKHTTSVFPKQFDRAIIATPTDLHFEWCNELAQYKVPILCEKPLSKNQNECGLLWDAPNLTVVNNYDYVLKDNEERPILYDYFRPGDDLRWSACQLLLRNSAMELKAESPTWRLETTKRVVWFDQVEKSYVRMIQDFVTKGAGMDVERAWDMTMRVLWRINEDNARRASAK